jgi:IclR family transcriptional regulator, acetate operon repressor
MNRTILRSSFDTADSANLGTASKGAVERTLAALDLLALADEPMRLSDIAQRLGMPKSAAHRMLTSLIESGWAEQSTGSDCYGLTLHMALIGQRQLSLLDIDNLRQPILDDLARRTKELVRLTTIQNNALVWTGSSRGRRVGLVYEPDMSEKINPYATANGKVWLSTLSREQAITIALDAGLGGTRRAGPAAITTIEGLLSELDATRNRGFGLAREEAEAGVGAVAVPIFRGANLVGTMSVAAPITRLEPAQVAEFVPLLKRAAENMALAWDGPPRRRHT